MNYRDRMRWRSNKYSVVSSTTKFDASPPTHSSYSPLRHTYTTDTSYTSKYSPSNSYARSTYGESRSATRDQLSAREAIKSKSLTLENVRRKSYAGLLSSNTYDVPDRWSSETMRRKSETVQQGKRRHFSTTEQRKISYSSVTCPRKLSYNSVTAPRKSSYCSAGEPRKLSYTSSVGGSNTLVSHDASLTVSRDVVSEECKERTNGTGSKIDDDIKAAISDNKASKNDINEDVDKHSNKDTSNVTIEKPESTTNAEPSTGKNENEDEEVLGEKKNSYEKLEDSATQAYIDLKKACMKKEKNRYVMGLKRFDYNALRKLPDPPSKKTNQQNKEEHLVNNSEFKDNKQENRATDSTASKVTHDCKLPTESLKESYWKNKLANYIKTGTVKDLCNLPPLVTSTNKTSRTNDVKESNPDDTAEFKPKKADRSSSQEDEQDLPDKGKRSTSMESESNMTMEGSINSNIDIDLADIENKCNGITEGTINLVLETKINLVVGRERNGKTEVHCNAIPEQQVSKLGNNTKGLMDYIYGGIRNSSASVNFVPSTKSKNVAEEQPVDALGKTTRKANVAMETKSYVAIETLKSDKEEQAENKEKPSVAQEEQKENKGKAKVESENKANVETDRHDFSIDETKSNASIETKTKVSMETHSNNEALETKSTVSLESQSNVSMNMKSTNKAEETKSTVALETKTKVAMETKYGIPTERARKEPNNMSDGALIPKRDSSISSSGRDSIIREKREILSEKHSSSGSETSSDTLYRNQYNRKQGRPLAAERITDFEHNALCLWHSLQRIHQGFVNVFHHHFPNKPGLLYKALKSHRVRLLQLQQRGLVEQSDWLMLFPEDGCTDSSNFDLVLLSVLLRTICEYREPKEGWWKVTANVETRDTIHFSKVFSVCSELSACNFSVNDVTFELLRKRLEKYTTMLSPPSIDLTENNDGGKQNDEFLQFSAAKMKLKTLEKKLVRVDKYLKAIWWNVPTYSQTHIIRNLQLLDDIQHRINTTATTPSETDSTSVFALLGPSGIGKTETARMLAYELCGQVDGNVVWINSQNVSSIDSAFVQLAKRLGLSLQDKFGKPVIVDGLHHHIYEHFIGQKSLFIFDNVKDDAMLQQVIPKSKSVFPIILVTSQSKTLGGNVKVCELEKFQEEETTKLVGQIADHCDERETKKLGEKMNNIPFTLELASHIISKRGITIVDFIKGFDRAASGEKYEKDAKGLIAVLVQMFIEGCAYDKNRTCIEELLCLCSLMHGNRIDMDLLMQWEDHSKSNIRAALKELLSYSLVKMTNYRDMNSKTCAFTIHPTVQYAIKKRKLDHIGDKSKTFHLKGFMEMYYLRKVLDLIANYKQYENKLNPSYGEIWAHHIVNILYYYKSYNAVMFKLEVFKHDIAIFNIQNRRYQSALHILELFRRFELALKVDNEDLLLDTERCYGNCFLMQGSFDAALSVFLKIHAKERNLFDSQQEQTLMTRFHIGICLQYLAISERQTETETASDLLKPRGSGTVFKKEDEKISAALSVFQDVYNKANKSLHGRHPLVVTAFHHIGICKYYQGDLSTALKIFLKVSEIVLDLDCETRPNDSLIEEQLRRMDERGGGGDNLSSDLAAFEELYARQKDLLGNSHPIALESKSQIAKCLQEVGSFVPALRHFSEIYSELKDLYGEEHPRTLTCREDIANCLRRTKEYAAAYEIYDDVRRKRVALLGDLHPSTLEAEYETGTCMYYLQNYEGGARTLRDVMDRKKKVYGELHASTLLTKQTYAICLRDAGDTANASRILQEVYEKYCVVYGENHPTTLSSRQQIGICHFRQLRFTIAYDVLKEVYDKYHALFGEENLRTLTSEYYVSLCLMKLGKFMDALILLRNICDNLDKLIGLDEPIYLDSAHHLGICLQAQGYLWTAINVFQEVYNLRKNHGDDASTLCSSQRLAMCCLDIGNHYAARYAFSELYENLKKK